MCGGKPPKDNSAEIARQQEEERQAKIKAGQASIDSTFDTQFTDEYFNKLGADYQGYYEPQLKTQYDDALKELTFQTARSGNAQSTTNNDQFAKLEQKRLEAATKIADDAKAAAGKARGDVANQRTNLYTLNNSSADPSQSASQAAQAALALNQPQSYSPLGSVFAALIQSGGNAAAINAASGGSLYQNNNGPAAPTGNSGSGKVVS